MAKKDNTGSVRNADNMSLREFATLCMSRWKWFAISLVAVVALAWLYIVRKEPVYERTEQLLVKNQDSGGGVGDISNIFSTMGFIGMKTNVNNELIALMSPAVMLDVVRELGLDMNYVKRGGMHPVTLYGRTLPYKVEMPDVGAGQGGSFRMILHPDGSMLLRNFRKSTPDGSETMDGEVSVAGVETSVKTPLGIVRIVPNPKYDGERENKDVEIDVSKTALQNAVEGYQEKVTGEIVDDYADVVDIEIKDVNVERAEDILNAILSVYNRNWVADKNKIAIATSDFIDERLRVIEKELGTVDSSLAQRLTATGTPDLIASAKVSMQKGAEIDKTVLELSNQLSMTEYMASFVADGENINSVIPANTGIDNPAIEKEIAEYNAILLTRNNLVANSSERNPLVADYDARLGGMRESISRGLANSVAGLRRLVENARREKTKTSGELAGTSAKALPLLSEERQQKVKEGLYLFLLQKREENQLSQKFTADNIRIITPPMGPLKPVAPKKMLIMAIAILLGLGVPMVAIYFIETGNTKVREKKDLEGLPVPFAGEIPQAGGKSRLRFKGKKMDVHPPLSVVREGERDVVNEAFRVLRGNIEFMSGNGTGCKRIMVTSFNPGSGKSFAAYNLGLSFALKQKRVLLIDCDLRHGSASMFVGSPSKGLTGYLSGNDGDWMKMTVKSADNDWLTVLPIGKMPPNPAELLDNGKIGKLLEDAGKEYDYVLLDCPPVNIVADTQIVGKYADITLFVLRASLLDKSALDELSEFYRDKKFKNMCVILNGTESTHSRYYTYGNYSGR